MPAQKSMFGVSGGTWGMLAAAHDLNDGKLAESRFNAAKTLGDMGPQANNWLALWRLKQGCEDICPAVRVASADALRKIGSPKAMKYLNEEIKKGYIPATTSNVAPPAPQS